MRKKHEKKAELKEQNPEVYEEREVNNNKESEQMQYRKKRDDFLEAMYGLAIFFNNSRFDEFKKISEESDYETIKKYVDDTIELYKQKRKEDEEQTKKKNISNLRKIGIKSKKYNNKTGIDDEVK